MKKIIALLLSVLLATFLLMFSMAYTHSDSNDSGIVLSEMSEQECLGFIISKGIVIPQYYAERADIGAFVKYLITEVEKNPNADVSYSYTKLNEFTDEIKKAVNNYYGKTANDSKALLYEYELQDSILATPWDSSCYGYNCYGYATMTYVYEDPGFYSNQQYDVSLGIYQVALLVRDDLEALGYDCVKITAQRPSSSTMFSIQKAVCVRNGTWAYHFMKFDNDIWYHKPATSAILRYNYLPAVSLIWTDEKVTKYGAEPGWIEYTGTIYYIIYCGEHNFIDTFTGSHNHSGTKHYYQYAKTCQYCEQTYTYWVSVDCSGPPCELPMLKISDIEMVEDSMLP